MTAKTDKTIALLLDMLQEAAALVARAARIGHKRWEAQLLLAEINKKINRLSGGPA